MKAKKNLIEYINKTYKAELTSSNTSFSEINKSKDVWWFNISKEKFKYPVNLLLKTDAGAFWIVLPAEFVTSLDDTFRIRKDKNAVDLEINAGSRNFLCDVKSGGTGFCFHPYIREQLYLDDT